MRVNARLVASGCITDLPQRLSSDYNDSISLPANRISTTPMLRSNQ
ncbi:hypothetical protein SAMN05216598_5691 [Pseudomonas asplenii]|uniref:Uncharacterized protein n=1 Tax=Pseudomonas asplenii TaxID=53407 RepID=A0A1H6NMZ9_9PSED|nr:hypothetical protein SAMN05216598_5691 [Pseudomonas asplenii]SEI14639.1 hypothetical protein SAMN05216581_2808 [Pseudomonas fuscovaginae]